MFRSIPIFVLGLVMVSAIGLAEQQNKANVPYPPSPMIKSSGGEESFPNVSYSI